MSPTERNREPVEGIINSLIMRLLRRMCSALQGDGNYVLLLLFILGFLRLFSTGRLRKYILHTFSNGSISMLISYTA